MSFPQDTSGIKNQHVTPLFGNKTCQQSIFTEGIKIELRTQEPHTFQIIPLSDTVIYNQETIFLFKKWRKQDMYYYGCSTYAPSLHPSDLPSQLSVTR